MPLPSLNHELIRARSADIRREVEALRIYASLPEPDFVRNAEKVRAARYGLVVAAEAAAAICTHLAARHGRVADSYPGCFELLAELGILDGDLGQRLAAHLRTLEGEMS